MTDKTTPTLTLSQAAMAAVTATLALIAWVRPMSPELQALILGLLSAWFVLGSMLWQRWLVSRRRVVEETPDGVTVVAGEANELPTGETIREDLGERPRRAA